MHGPGIPIREDWGVIDRDDLDAACAFDTFFGPSLANARALFVENALFFQEELGSLPPIPFRFYVRAFIDYVESDDAAGDPDAASSLLFLFEEMLSRTGPIVAVGFGYRVAEAVAGTFSPGPPASWAAFWARVRMILVDGQC